MAEETRRPDPTLSAHDGDVVLRGDNPCIAHLWLDEDGCGVVPDSHQPGWSDEPSPAEHARWFAVPCRSCFPDAPEPGYRVGHGPECCTPAEGLAWQLGETR